jgi:hypothetical protein
METGKQQNETLRQLEKKLPKLVFSKKFFKINVKAWEM